MQDSKLFDQNTFDRAFMRDLLHAKHEVIIESPFMTTRRMDALLPTLTKIRQRSIQITVNTRDPETHEGGYHYQAVSAVDAMQELGVRVLYTVGHHRKIAIIDRSIIYEGSLNILSFNDSCEIMRRIVSPQEAVKLLKFTGLMKYVGRK
jgi:phosphatidylserine/phosphatidylglycerophosphate/cardiolipin synthase-like enzyme